MNIMNFQEDIIIRPIEPSDNPHLAVIIRTTLAEFGASHPGTVYYDPTTDALSKESGFRKIYLETMPELRQALIVYEKSGFRYLKGPMGNSGHFGCERWMIRNLEG